MIVAFSVGRVCCTCCFYLSLLLFFPFRIHDDRPSGLLSCIVCFCFLLHRAYGVVTSVHFGIAFEFCLLQEHKHHERGEDTKHIIHIHHYVVFIFLLFCSSSSFLYFEWHRYIHFCIHNTTEVRCKTLATLIWIARPTGSNG